MQDLKKITILSRALVVTAAAALALGCSGAVNASGGNPSGVAIAGQTCAPATQGEVCGMAGGQTAHLKCDSGTKAWTLVESCGAGTSCSSVNGAFVCKAPTATQPDGGAPDAVGDAAATDADVSLADIAAGELPKPDGQLADSGPNSDACKCIQVGDYYRFSALQLTSMDGSPDFAVLPVLNSLWQSDVDGYELNILLQVAAVSATDVTWQVVDGARVGTTQEPCLLPPTQTTIHQKRNGCQLLDSDAGALNLYAGSQQHTKNCGSLAGSSLGVDNTIPLRGVVLNGTMHADCSAIDSGTMQSAAIAKDALFKLCTCQTLPGQTSDVCAPPDPSYKDTTSSLAGACDGCGPGWQSFGGLLAAFAGDVGLQYGCKSDTGGPAVCLTATFAATRLSAWTPAACGN